MSVHPCRTVVGVQTHKYVYCRSKTRNKTVDDYDVTVTHWLATITYHIGLCSGKSVEKRIFKEERKGTQRQCAIAAVADRQKSYEIFLFNEFPLFNIFVLNGTCFGTNVKCSYFLFSYLADAHGCCNSYFCRSMQCHFVSFVFRAEIFKW